MNFGCKGFEEGLVVQNGVSEQKGIGGSEEALGVPEDFTKKTRVKKSEEFVGELTTNTDTNMVIVFDFDWSLIDCNSDTWVVEKLGGGDTMKSLLHTLPWTQLMVCISTLPCPCFCWRHRQKRRRERLCMGFSVGFSVGLPSINLWFVFLLCQTKVVVFVFVPLAHAWSLHPVFTVLLRSVQF